MKYMITHSCGHCVEHVLFGPSKDRQRKVEWMETIPCSECQREEDQKAREEKAKEMGLPELTGTEKQVAWAQKIRLSILDTLSEKHTAMYCKFDGITEEQYTKAVEYAASIESASWWIENRDVMTMSKLVRGILDEIRVNELENSPEAKAVKAEMVIMEPEEKRTSTVCTLTATKSAILIRSDRDEHIRLTVKARGFSWDGAKTAWVKPITELTGSGKDLAPDTARILLEAGIPVKTYPSILQAVQEGSYERQTKRWVSRSTKSPDKLFIKKVKDVYLPDSCRTTYDGDGIISPNCWKEIREFIELNGYKVTKEAEEMLRKAEEATVSVKPAVKKDEEGGTEDKLKAILESSRDILDDLKDED